MFLARKVKLSKWEPKPGLAAGEISADAVTADLRTRDLSLSLWSCGAARTSEIEDVALALGAGMQQLESVDIVWVSKADLEADGCPVVLSEGRTPVEPMRDKHADLTLLDYVRLGRVARRVVTAIERGHCQSVTRLRMKKLLANAVSEKRLDLAELEEKTRRVVESTIGLQSSDS